MPRALLPVGRVGSVTGHCVYPLVLAGHALTSVRTRSLVSHSTHRVAELCMPTTPCALVAFQAVEVRSSERAAGIGCSHILACSEHGRRARGRAAGFRNSPGGRAKGSLPGPHAGCCQRSVFGRKETCDHRPQNRCPDVALQTRERVALSRRARKRRAMHHVRAPPGRLHTCLHVPCEHVAELRQEPRWLPSRHVTRVWLLLQMRFWPVEIGSAFQFVQRGCLSSRTVKTGLSTTGLRRGAA